MKVKIEFSVDNAAFTDDFTREVGRVLHTAKEKIIMKYLDSGRPVGDILLDTNGNRIGTVEVS